MAKKPDKVAMLDEDQQVFFKRNPAGVLEADVFKGANITPPGPWLGDLGNVPQDLTPGLDMKTHLVIRLAKAGKPVVVIPASPSGCTFDLIGRK